MCFFAKVVYSDFCVERERNILWHPQSRLQAHTSRRQLVRYNTITRTRERDITLHTLTQHTEKGNTRTRARESWGRACARPARIPRMHAGCDVCVDTGLRPPCCGWGEGAVRDRGSAQRHGAYGQRPCRETRHSWGRGISVCAWLRRRDDLIPMAARWAVVGRSSGLMRRAILGRTPSVAAGARTLVGGMSAFCPFSDVELDRVADLISL